MNKRMTEHIQGICPSGRIRIVHFVNTWLPQTMTWLQNQIEFLPGEAENFIVCKKTENLNQFRAPNIYSLETFPRWAQYLQRLKRSLRLSPAFGLHLPLLDQVLRNVKPNILHTHFGHLGWVNAALARRHGVKHVVSFYGADVNHVPHTDPRWLARYQEMGSVLDQVLCEGPFMTDSIASLGIPRQKIKVQRLGVDLSKIRYEPRCYENGTKLRFLIVGTFREKKGIPYALEALGRFQRINHHFEITIIGNAYPPEEKAEKEKIIRTIREWGLQSKTRLLGFQPYDVVLQEAYRHHIFLSASLTAQDGDCEGGAPVCIIEMAATGMPIISTRHCDIPFVLSKENAPYLVNERDSEALCQAVARLASSDWQDLVASNRRLIDEELDVRRQGRKLYEIYRGLL